MKPIFLFLSAALFILHSLSLATGSLQESCKKASESGTVDLGFCVSSLQVDPNSRAADAKGLAGIAAKFTKANFTDTKTKFDRHLRRGEGPTSPIPLRQCSESYESGILHIDSATSRIQSGNISGAMEAVFKVMLAPDVCYEWFEAAGLDDLLFVNETDNARQLSRIFAEFTSFLRK